MERNDLLEEARLEQGLSVREASRCLGIHRNTLADWEAGKRMPQISLLPALCELYNKTAKELGYEHLLRAKQKLKQEVLLAQDTALSEQPTSSRPDERGILRFEDLEVRLLIVVGQWDRRNTSYDELQVKVVHQIRSYDEMTEQSSIENPERRKALRILASLPVGIYGLTTRGTTKPVHAEELLPQCAAGLTACWQLSKGSDLALVRETVSAYLPILAAFAKQPGRHQQVAAGLTAQCHMLMGLMSMHLDGLASGKDHYTKAVTYSQLADDSNLIAASWGWLASIYRYDKLPSQALEAYKYALPYLAVTSSVVRSSIYVNLADVQAKCGYEQDARRSLELAHESFALYPQGNDDVPYALHDRFTLALADGRTQYNLEKYESALASYTQISNTSSKGSVPERVRLEILNNQALTALRLKELEKSCHYLTLAATGAMALDSVRRYAEAYDIFEKMDVVWGTEPQVRTLKDIFKQK